MPEETETTLDNGKVYFTCPFCGDNLCLDPEWQKGDHEGHNKFNVVSTSFGVTVTPKWSCECGLVGKVRHNEVKELGRKEIPPEYTVLPAREVEEKGRQGTTIEVRPVETEASDRITPSGRTYSKEECPRRSSHGFLGKKGSTCEFCLTDFSDSSDDD